jgi:hypothetical protein
MTPERWGVALVIVLMLAAWSVAVIVSWLILRLIT